MRIGVLFVLFLAVNSAMAGDRGMTRETSDAIKRMTGSSWDNSSFLISRAYNSLSRVTRDAVSLTRRSPDERPEKDRLAAELGRALETFVVALQESKDDPFVNFTDYRREIDLGLLATLHEEPVPVLATGETGGSFKARLAEARELLKRYRPALDVWAAAHQLPVSPVIRNDESGSSAQVEDLIAKIEAGNQQAILESGKLGDMSIAPLLQEIIRTASHNNFGGPAAAAQMALAKLGDHTAFKEILAELNDDDPALQDAAVKKLTYVGGNASVWALASLLDKKAWRSMNGFDPDRRGPNGELPQGRVVYFPLNCLAMRALAQIVPNPHASQKISPDDPESLQVWEMWWEENKANYE